MLHISHGFLRTGPNRLPDRHSAKSCGVLQSKWNSLPYLLLPTPEYMYRLASVEVNTNHVFAEP